MGTAAGRKSAACPVRRSCGGRAEFRKITRYCSQIGIRYLTVYAFSTENWSRPQEEVSALMRLFRQYLEEALRDFRDDDIVVRFLGDISAFSAPLRELITETQELSASRSGMVLNIAMNYGGRAELTHAFQDLARRVQEGSLRRRTSRRSAFPPRFTRPASRTRISSSGPAGNTAPAIFCCGSRPMRNM